MSASYTCHKCKGPCDGTLGTDPICHGCARKYYPAFMKQLDDALDGMVSGGRRLMANITREEFLEQKKNAIGLDNLTERYGCPYWVLQEWANHEVAWNADIITYARQNKNIQRHADLLEYVKAANAGINKIGQEYQDAIATGQVRHTETKRRSAL